jgi:hypothetical protein
MGVSELDSDVVGSEALSLSLSLPQAARDMDAVSARAARPIERVRSLVFMTLPFGWSLRGGLGARCREVFGAGCRADGWFGEKLWTILGHAAKYAVER